MTEFTKDDIEHYRKQYALWTSRKQTMPEELHLIGRLRDALDHIEHLQARVAELEVEEKQVCEWKANPTRRNADRVKIKQALLDGLKRWIAERGKG